MTHHLILGAMIVVFGIGAIITIPDARLLNVMAVAIGIKYLIRWHYARKS